MTKNLTRAQCIEMYHSESWKDMSHKERALLQLNTSTLFMPFNKFKESVSESVGRDIRELDLAFDTKYLIKEIEGRKK